MKKQIPTEIEYKRNKANTVKCAFGCKSDDPSIDAFVETGSVINVGSSIDCGVLEHQECGFFWRHLVGWWPAGDVNLIFCSDSINTVYVSPIT